MTGARFALAFTAGVAATLFASAAVASPDGEVGAYLRTNLSPDPCTEVERPTHYAVSWVDLDADRRPEALVYLSGGQMCGSGGCSFMVLERTPRGFRTRADVSVTNPPIVVLPDRSHGWRDIAVRVRFGATRSRMAALSFDGKAYPGNPSVPPARKLPGRVEGGVAFPASAALFPAAKTPATPTNMPDGRVRVLGRVVEVSLPEPTEQCWSWRRIVKPTDPPLAYRPGRSERDASGRIVANVWAYEANGPVRGSLEFVLIPGWRFIYGDDKVRAAAVKTYRPEIVVP